MSPVWRILLLAGVAAIATEPPFAPRRMAAPAPQPAATLPAAPTTVYPPVQVASYGNAPLEARRSVPTEFMRTEIDYASSERPGTIIVDTRAKHLYLVQGSGRAIRYGIGVGRPGFTWAGVKTISRKAEWPGWTPPPEMLKRRPDLPKHMEGGPDNPLGARALSRLVALSHPRHERALYHRTKCLVGLHSHDEPGCRRPV
jgi:lipoprotein-anchoring transpeptidase ErfK/SrfK